MRSLTRLLSFANVMSLIAVFIALGGSALAVQVAKKNSVNSRSIRNNTIRSKDLKNGQVKATDIGAGQVRSSEIGDGQVGSSEVADGQIGTAEVADGSLSATDIDINSLGDATSGGSESFPALVCTLTTTSNQQCADTTFSLERSGRIFATVDGSADSGGPSVSVGVSTCLLTADGAPFTEDFIIGATFNPGATFSFSGVSAPLTAGPHTLSFDCHGNGTVPGPRIFKPNLTYLKFGAG